MASPMVKLRHILFPYDFPAQGQLVAPFVRALARTFDARITILSVDPPTFEAVPDTMESQLEPSGAGELASLQGERVSDRGDPAIRIVDFAHSHDVDLIMMPTHGPGRFR
jgi:nucleotide-binding universal stress UspA family protein